MGVVWKATDVTLHRAVALKVLPEAFARDPERVARFEREARLLASLNHPNIAAIYGLETDGPLRVLAMEFVPGDTLRDRLARGALPLSEALPIALKIAEALESAHERGIVHRDLKPANVAVTPDGDVKLLDFGLARAFAPDGETAVRTDDSPTISAVMTRGDVILGTAAYMSPEQARGKLVDRRSDIWSFGLVLFEMLTGKPVFEGDTTSDLLAAVLRQDIPWDRLPKDTPPNVRELLERCLTRDPRERLRDIGEARILLARKPSAVARRTSPTWWLAPALALVVGGLASWWITSRTRSGPPESGAIRRLALETVAEPRSTTPTVSPDGRQVAYFDKGSLWVRDLGQLDARSVLEDANAMRPFWSPDSRNVGYLSGTKVKRVAASGGTSETIVDLPFTFGVGGEGGTWTDDGHIVVSQGRESGLIQVPDHGGEPQTLIAPDTTREGDFHDPCVLPGGRGILVGVHTKIGVEDIAVVQDGKLRTLLHIAGQTLGHPQYSATGHIVFDRKTPPSGIWAVPFSLAGMKTTGKPFLVVADGFDPSVTPDGSLLYVAPATQPLEFCWVDRAGTPVQHMSSVGAVREDGGLFHLAPDGDRVVATFGTDIDLWVYDLAHGTQTRLTDSPGYDVNASFSPDGRRVLYQSNPTPQSHLEAWSILSRNADGSDTPDTLVKGGAVMPALSPDGGTLFYGFIDGENGWPIRSRTLANGATTTLTHDGHVHFGPSVSPDGRWIVYLQSDGVPSGHPDIVLQSLATGSRTVIGKGLWPKWNQKGDRLYYVDRDDMMEVHMGTGDPPVSGPPVKLFTRPPVNSTLVFDWTPEFAVRGDRFLTLRPIGESRPTSIVLVQNWAAEFAGVTSRRP